MTLRKPAITCRTTLLAGCAVLALLAGVPSSGAAGADADWNPAASERLVKLPPHLLKKAVDRDYQASGLAAAISDTGSRISAKGQTLADLKGAAEKADSELRLELQHQFLVEKQAYVRLMGERLELRARQTETRRKLYETLLSKAQRQGAARDSVTAGLAAARQAARERFASSLESVDMQVFGSEFAPESRYGAEYARNKAAMDSLLGAISAHPMNAQPAADGEEITREDYLRQLIGDLEAESALVAQEEQILGFMAKLVALDAMALAEGMSEATGAEGPSGINAGPGLAAAVDLFVSN